MYHKQPAPWFRLTFLLFLFLGFVLPLGARGSESNTKSDMEQPLETGDLWESPFFSGIVIEPREISPQVKVPQVTEPVEREEISFDSDVRNYILQVEEENTHQIYPKEPPNK